MFGIPELALSLRKDYFPQNHLKGLVLLFGITSVGVISYFYRKWLANKPPKKWRLVGEISEIFCYPVRSCAPIRITSKIRCTNIGLQDHHIRERVFVIVTNNFAQQSAQAKLLLIQPRIFDDTLTLAAPSMPDFHLNIPRLYTNVKISHPDHPSGVVDCGSEIAKWLSTYITGNDSGNRLVFYPDTDFIRKYRKTHLKLKETGFIQLPTEFQGFMMINSQSVEDLNTRIDQAVTPLQFRPNFVVKNAEAFDEDNWKWVRIGDNLIFKYTGPCLRCYQVTMDPEKGTQDKKQEPLKTLKSFRCFGNCNAPVMGIYLLSLSSGDISCGDAVYIGNE